MLLLLLFASIIHDVISSSHDEYRIIETNDGHIRGKSGTTLLDNVSYYSFKGIPYAKAPTGNLRFKVNTVFILKSFRKFFDFRVNQQIELIMFDISF